MTILDTGSGSSEAGVDSAITKAPPPSPGVHGLFTHHLLQLKSNFLSDTAASSSTITEVVQYYARRPSKQLRPSLILLMSLATNGLSTNWSIKKGDGSNTNEPLSSVDTASLAHTVLPTQLRLAEVIEMIHVASLLHDDVIDESSLRRGGMSAPARFGNKTAVLGGDFLVGRAWALCGSLGDAEVMGLIGTIMSTMVEGELVQLQETLSDATDDVRTEHTSRMVPSWQSYIGKTYMKTASLLSTALACTVILGGAIASDVVKEAATTYGRELGMAFQIMDDVLDYEGGEAMGKPVDATDLKLGLSTAPVFFALKENKDMLPLVQRRFKGEGDVEKALAIVKTSNALSRSKDLAWEYSQKAVLALSTFPPSDGKSALVAFAVQVVVRDS